jgi:peptidylprolyl isomerase
MKLNFGYILLLFGSALFAHEPELEKKNSKEAAENLEQISRTMGHLIGENLQSLGLTLDIDALVRGMQESCDGVAAPLSEDECIAALSILHDEIQLAEAEKNLLEANQFLQSNGEHEGIVTLETGKLQYQTTKPGSGESVETYNSPVIRYKASYLNGQVFGNSNEAEMISLDETISGLSKGVIGMREGEVRTLYIHPDLGYGNQGPTDPNTLLIFEVELLKADASAAAQAAARAEDAISLDDPALR